MSHNRVSKYMRPTWIELQGKICKSMIIVRDFNSIVSAMDRSSRKKISKDIDELNIIINQPDITDSCRLLHPATVEYTLF